MGGLAGQRILLGITGGIAAYKAADLARRLQDAGAQVRVVMTEGAQHFITATTLQALTGEPVRTSLWDAAAEAAMGHIELARWATRVVVAPASADFIARLAHGFASDLLGTLCLATEAPIAIAPAMNHVMWANVATQANVEVLLRRGVAILGPAVGDQACGEVGAGRMLEPLDIVSALGATSKDKPGALAGKRILVSAGPTYEDVDPVRFIGNRSSGKMGFALAAEAAGMGAIVTLVAGPVSLPTPAGVTRIDVRSANQMREAVIGALGGQDAYIGAAAIADYMPAQVYGQKIKKGSTTALELPLVRTPDVLAEVAKHAARPRVVVGFAAETQELEQNALAKLRDKHLDLIAANDVSAPGVGFNSEENALQVYFAGGRRDIPRGPKPVVARGLLDMIAERLA
jgi:phosphopantothenoylcysteine decarboxylase/phosphopantothenate--cysteine ligase